MSRVFVVQNQQKLNSRTGGLEARFDLAPAEEYGELVHLLSPTTKPFSSDGVVRVLRDKLQSYSDNDYLLLVGNPCLIGFVVAIAASMNKGRVRVLQWHGKDQRYIPVHAELY